MSLFGAGSSSTNVASPPPFQAINIPQAVQLGTAYDTLGYQLSDQDFLSRFPGLVALRDSQISDAVKEVTGPLDPDIQNTFVTKGQSDALTAFGGSTGTIGEEGSAARGAIAGSVAKQVGDKQDQDQLNLMNLMAVNPERQFGPSGADLVNMLIGNVVGQNQRNYQAYAGGIQQSNAQSAAATSQLFSSAQLGVSLVGIAIAL